MLTVRLNDIDYSIKQKVNEFTIGEFEQITNILNNSELDELEKYYEIFIVTGLSEEILEELEIKKFLELIRLFLEESEFNFSNLEKVKEFSINNRIYRAYEDEFKLKVKEMKLIEKYIKKNEKQTLSYILAILFKDIELTENEHYVEAHINHKANLIRENITANIAVPYISYFSEKFVNVFENLGK
jgi:hypothetical protein